MVSDGVHRDGKRKTKKFIDKKKAFSFHIVAKGGAGVVGVNDPEAETFTGEEAANEEQKQKFFLQPNFGRKKLNKLPADFPQEVLFAGDGEAEEEERYWQSEKVKRKAEKIAEDPAYLPHEYDYSVHLKPMSGEGLFFAAPNLSEKYDVAKDPRYNPEVIRKRKELEEEERKELKSVNTELIREVEKVRKEIKRAGKRAKMDRDFWKALHMDEEGGVVLEDHEVEEMKEEKKQADKKKKKKQAKAADATAAKQVDFDVNEDELEEGVFEPLEDDFVLKAMAISEEELKELEDRKKRRQEAKERGEKLEDEEDDWDEEDYPDEPYGEYEEYYEDEDGEFDEDGEDEEGEDGEDKPKRKAKAVDERINLADLLDKPKKKKAAAAAAQEDDEAGEDYEDYEDYEYEDDEDYEDDETGLDKAFDKMLEEYDEDEGDPALEGVDPRQLQGEKRLKEYQSDFDAYSNLKSKSISQGGTVIDNVDESLKKMTLQKLDLVEDEDDETVNQRINQMFKRKPVEKWDAESIVSTYSNTENHPTILREPRRDKSKEIKISKRTGIPLGVLSIPERGKKNKDKKQSKDEHDEDQEDHDEEAEGDEDEEEEEEEEEKANLGAPRSKYETPEEKKRRKAEAKAAKQANRQRKKQLKTIFTQEALNLQMKQAERKKNNPLGTNRL